MAEVRFKALLKFFPRLKVCDLRKIQRHDVVGLVLPKLFDGKTLKILQPVPKKRLEGGEEKRLAKTRRTGEKKLLPLDG